jgi:hypothetical protein
MSDVLPSSSHIFSFKVEGPQIQDMAIPGDKRWFVVYRHTPNGLAHLIQHLTRIEAHNELYRLRENPAIVSIGLWEQVYLETWRRP